MILYAPLVPRGNAASSQTTKATLGLRELVLEGELVPGERVPEVELSSRLGVSRTPLRIALATLAHEGLLEALPGGGFVVRSFTYDDVVDGIELRGVLEGTAARLAAERLGSRRELAQLRAAVEELDPVVAGLGRGGDHTAALVRFVAANESFHDGLVALAKSPVLAHSIANVLALPFASPNALLSSHAVLPRSREILVVAQHQHHALLEAIADGHGTRAEEIAREHARLARGNLELVLDDHDALAALRGGPLLRSVAGA
jgi:GntR family transcriptional regulator of vanillate catabolism